jgi:NNP family nitrate/nitrite transporter-like MFS transporter
MPDGPTASSADSELSPDRTETKSELSSVHSSELITPSQSASMAIPVRSPRGASRRDEDEVEIREVFGCENDCGFRSYSYTAVLNHEATCQYVSSGPGASPADPYRRYKLKVNHENKATELPLLRLGGTGRENPHMRAFWGSAISVFMGFFGWFALAPVTLDVMHSVGVCENQLFVVGKDLTRKAFVEYVNKDNTQAYCVHGKLADSSDCNDIPADSNQIFACGEDATSQDCFFAQTHKYNFAALLKVKCVCDSGTECKGHVSRGVCASALSAIIGRVLIGAALEVWGPVRVQSSLLAFTGISVALAAAIESPHRYVVMRFLTGFSGATFITNQFWCSLMFAPNVVGTANATAAGWGNLGGGAAQIFIIWGLMIPLRRLLSLDEDVSWRLAMLVPASLMMLLSAFGSSLCWDTPNLRRFDKPEGPDYFSGYIICLKNFKVIVMMIQYAACFGTEVTMNNLLPTYLRVYFEMSAGTAAFLAGMFGAMNIFARSLGGILSDEMFARFGFRGRLWAQFIALVLQGVFFWEFSQVTKNHEWYHLLGTIIPFSICVNLGEGTSYGIVPFVIKEQLAVVNAIVGASGTAGAVFASVFFYNHDWDDARTPFAKHAQFVLFASLLSPLYYWPEYGSMFSPPAIANSDAMRESKSVQDSRTTVGSMALLAARMRPRLERQVSRDESTTKRSDNDFLDMVRPKNAHPNIPVAAASQRQKQELHCVDVDSQAIGASRRV